MPFRDTAQSYSRPTTPSAVSTPSEANSADRDTFAVLDSAAAGPQTTWIRSGAHHAEAGYLDPALGWVSVRADGTAAGMHAALVPGSPDAASALSNHLAGLNAFLADHHGHAATVTLAAPESGSSLLDSAANGQHGQQSQQQRDQTAPESRDSNSSPLPWEPDPAATRLAVAQSFSGMPAPNGSGVHLSVMA